MVKVYFDNGTTADLIAVFVDEELYLKCIGALMKEAKEANCTLVESVVETELEQIIEE